MWKMSLVLVLVLCCALAVGATGCSGSPPADEQMISHFHEHWSQFAELLDGYSADDLRELGIVEGGPAVWSSNPEAQAFVTSYRRWMGDSWWKGYVYSKLPLTPSVNTIDEDTEGLVYRHIGSGWYLFYRNEG